MIKLTVYDYGLDTICEEAEEILTKVMGTVYSKKEKDIAISQTLGLIKALRLAYEVEEIKEEPEPEVTEND